MADAMSAAAPLGEGSAPLVEGSAAAGQGSAPLGEGSAAAGQGSAPQVGGSAASGQGSAPPSRGSLASGQGSASDLVNEDAMCVLKMSKGVFRVPLEELGPALFNRHGEATSGAHCHKLAKRILTLEGFATFRYVAGFCHEPDPKDPLAVSRHGNNMKATDNSLPRLPAKPLKGVFAKTHLVTFLQLYKNGQIPIASGEEASSQCDGAENQSRVELQDALEHGVFMHVFPWSVVRDHREAVIKLMAADNFDHGHGLADSEMRCIKAVRSSIAASSQGSLPVPLGLSQFDVVLRHVTQMSGQRWREQDIGNFWDFGKSTLEAHFDLMHEIWLFAECESSLRVEAAWFGAIAKVNTLLQWTRASLVVAHILSDREKECSVVAGQCVAGAIRKVVVKQIREREAALSQDVEDWVQSVMNTYWMPTQDRETRPVSREVGLPAVAAFLDRVGRLLAQPVLVDLPEKKAKFETKLRSAMEKGWKGSMPEPLTPLRLGAKEPGSQNWTDKLDAQPMVVADSAGRAVVGVKRQAQNKHLEVGVRVEAKRTRLGAKEPETASATISAISDEGVQVKWDEPEKSGCIESLLLVSDIELAKKKREADPTKSGILDVEACKWSPCSTAANNEMLLTLTTATLYQAYVGRSAAHEDLHVVFDKGVFAMYARREMKPGALVMLPFGDILDPAVAPAGSVPIAIVIGGNAVSEMRLRAKNTPKKLGTNEKAVVLVPFWVLATRPASSTKSAAVVPNLVYKTTTMQVNQAPKVEKTQGKEKHAIVIKTICITNDEVVPKGAPLAVKGVLPTTLA